MEDEVGSVDEDEEELDGGEVAVGGDDGTECVGAALLFKLTTHSSAT